MDEPTPGPAAYFDWNGLRWTRHAKDGYYRDRTGFLLHRALWTAEVGPIEVGHEIHHRDENRANNALGNLESKPQFEHRSEHSLTITHPRWIDAQTSESARKRANDLWANRKPRAVACHQCGTEFMSTGMRSKFCGPNCGARYFRAKRRAELGL